MNVKTNRKKLTNNRVPINYCLWVREVVCDNQRKQKSAAAKRQIPAPQAAMQRHCIATNHL
jgi:hypothetical protein